MLHVTVISQYNVSVKVILETGSTLVPPPTLIKVCWQCRAVQWSGVEWQLDYSGMLGEGRERRERREGGREGGVLSSRLGRGED